MVPVEEKETPTCSETISELTKALCKAQGQMENAEKDATNPHFRSSYASLASVINAVKRPLSENGLAFTQYLESTGPDLFLITKLMHVSGEWQSSRLHLLISKQDMQGLGSALSYARRYALSAIVGISQEDDDGNKASTHTKVAPQENWRQETYQNPGYITTKQMQRFFAIGYENNWSLAEMLDLLNKGGVDSAEKIPTEKYDKVCEYLEKHPKEKK